MHPVSEKTPSPTRDRLNKESSGIIKELYKKGASNMKVSKPSKMIF